MYQIGTKKTSDNTVVGDMAADKQTVFSESSTDRNTDIKDAPEAATPTSAPTHDLTRKPSAADLDEINTNIVYPRKDEYYLPEYVTKYVQADGNNKAVYAFINPSNRVGMKQGNYFKVYNGEKVTVLAEGGGYSCVIIVSTNKAAWINSDYLIDG